MPALEQALKSAVGHLPSYVPQTVRDAWQEIANYGQALANDKGTILGFLVPLDRPDLEEKLDGMLEDIMEAKRYPTRYILPSGAPVVMLEKTFSAAGTRDEVIAQMGLRVDEIERKDRPILAGEEPPSAPVAIRPSVAG